MFPIRDSSGRIVAFTGRALAADEQAKYLNSPETELYHKSEILYGLDRAKDAIRTRGFVMLVEGQMDVIHSHQAGFANAVALSGTALTGKHVSVMKRYSENLMLVLDMDQAGLAATAKSAQLALLEGMRVKAARLEGGKDPADLIMSGPDGAKEFAKSVKEAKPVVEFFLAVLAERERDPHRLVALAEKVVLPLIRAVQSAMEREHFVQNAARALGLSAEAVRETLGKVKTEVPVAVSPRAAAPQAVSRGEILIAAMHAYPDSALAKRIEAEYNRITGVHPVSLDAPLQAVLFQAEQMFGEGPSEGAADELLSAFEEAVVREAYQEEVRELRRAEASGDAAAVIRAQNACAELSGRLARLGR